jgi:hypothetical protein
MTVRRKPPPFETFASLRLLQLGRDYSRVTPVRERVFA